MAEDAATGFGIDFQSGNGADPEVFATIGEIVDVTPPNVSRDTVEVTHSKSPDKFREFIGGLRDGGEASVDVHWNPSSAKVAELYADLEVDTPKNYRVLFPDTANFTVAALITGIEPSTPIDDRMVCTVSFKVSGKPVLTPAA